MKTTVLDIIMIIPYIAFASFLCFLVYKVFLEFGIPLLIVMVFIAWFIASLSYWKGR